MSGSFEKEAAATDKPLHFSIAFGTLRQWRIRHGLLALKPRAA
jgi:hypothetical protein